MTRATEDTVIKLPPRLGIGNRERTEAIVDAWVPGPRSDYLDQELCVAVESADHALRFIIEESRFEVEDVSENLGAT